MQIEEQLNEETEASFMLFENMKERRSELNKVTFNGCKIVLSDRTAIVGVIAACYGFHELCELLKRCTCTVKHGNSYVQISSLPGAE
jgi:hypothetical protein